ncbi:MAG TPA: DUF805 domain-containing protein [Rhizomicrobium sp.]|nr:DUF805 domain-containing protein [Rhizomicrobium sp.]
MNWGSYLFSFHGRINRAKLWLFILIVIGIEIVYFTLFSILFGGSLVAMLKGGPAGLMAGGASMGLGAILTCVVILAVIFASVAVTVKRLHDRNKSAWWLIVFWLIPFVINCAVFASMIGQMHAEAGAVPMTNPVMMVLRLVSLVLTIWAFVELYCLRGTVGENRYGPDPLAGPA